MYTVPDPGYVYGWSSSNMLVPILVGMDFCMKTCLILDFSDGHALHGADPGAEPYSMKRNPKGHYMVDLVNYMCGVSLDSGAMLDGAAAMLSDECDGAEQGLGSWSWFGVSLMEFQH